MWARHCIVVTQPQHSDLLLQMAKLTDLSDSEDDEIMFMTADERQKAKSKEKESSDPRDTKYTTENVASIAMLMEEEDIPCFVVGSSALRYYGAALVQSVSFFFSLITIDLISFFFLVLRFCRQE